MKETLNKTPWGNTKIVPGQKHHQTAREEEKLKTKHHCHFQNVKEWNKYRQKDLFWKALIKISEIKKQEIKSNRRNLIKLWFCKEVS